MTTASYKLNSAPLHRAMSEAAWRVQSVRSVLLTVSPAFLRRGLALAVVLFAVLYVGAAHFTLYEGGRFAELQGGLRKAEMTQLKQEALLTELLSARAIREGRDTEGLVEVSAISYVEGRNVFVEATPAVQKY